jgi:hypothetical protein
LATILAVSILGAALSAQRGDPHAGVAERVMRLTRDTPWTLVGTVPVTFPTHHPQGMVKIRDTFFVSSVEITVRTRRFPKPVDGYDRDTGAGVGHLFKLDAQGKLLADLRLGEGAIYHPGGIDYDGRYIWVPVAEYRPDSRSILYRVDPESMKATEMLRFDDHIGAIVHDTDAGALHGVSWGSRRFYRWTLTRDGASTPPAASPGQVRRLNPSHYVDYQDCKYAGAHRMLCTGIGDVRAGTDAAPVRIGGIELIDLADGRPVHQVPLRLQTAGGVNMVQNPAWFEAGRAGALRASFMPEDDRSTIYVFEAGTR